MAAIVVTAIASCGSDENDYEIDGMGDGAISHNEGDYKAVSGISGKISSVGSDTLANLMTFWSEGFKRYYPNVDIQVQAAGSSTAPPALIEGTSNLGPMSRKMKDGEIEAFEKKFGYRPTGIRVAIDALAVYVHKDNPIEGLKISQIDAIFSSTRKCGNRKDISNWGQVGLSGDWANREIQIYGRNSVSGTYGYFKKKALCKGDYKNSVNEQPGSASVVQSIGTSLNGIGYSGIGYKTASVKTLAVSKTGELIAPTEDKILSGEYPLSRFLYVYVNKAPNKELPLLEKEFLKMVLSKVGQKDVVKDGYVALPEAVMKEELQKLH